MPDTKTRPCWGCNVKQVGRRVSSIFDPRKKICDACSSFEESEIRLGRELTKVGRGF